MTLNVPILVIYDDMKNKVPDVLGEVSDFVGFCRSIEMGHIANVRQRCPFCSQVLLPLKRMS